MVDDPALPAAGALLGDAAGELFAAAFGAAVGKVAPYELRYEPGGWLRVCSIASLTWPDGRETEELVVAMTGADGVPGVEPIAFAGSTACAWRFQHDPYLPGLAGIVDGGKLLVDDLVPDLTLQSYHAGVHAVLSANAAGADVAAVKVVRPDRFAGVRRAAERLQFHAAIPQLVDVDADQQAIATAWIAGESLWDALLAGDPVPGPDALLTLLDELGGVGTEWEVESRTAVERASSVASFLAAVAPELRDGAERIAERIARVHESPTAPLRTIHGDLHEAQVLLDPRGTIVGLLDVDTAGMGRPVDDLAMLGGRLWARSRLLEDESQRLRAEAYADELIVAFERAVGPTPLWRTVAAVVLEYVNAPFREMRPEWMTVATQLVALATEACERM